MPRETQASNRTPAPATPLGTTAPAAAVKAKVTVVAPPVPTARFRVLRNILHGKTPLTPGMLVDMKVSDAQHLVNTQALAAHVVDRPVTILADATGDSDAVVKGAISAPVTGAEQETADANASTEGLTEDTAEGALEAARIRGELGAAV